MKFKDIEVGQWFKKHSDREFSTNNYWPDTYGEHYNYLDAYVYLCVKTSDEPQWGLGKLNYRISPTRNRFNTLTSWGTIRVYVPDYEVEPAEQPEDTTPHPAYE